MPSTFFAVVHHFKAGKAEEWWPAMTEMMSSPEQMAAFVEKQNALGFHGHAFMPTSKDGDIFCLWEAQEGKAASDFQEFIDGEDGPSFGCFNNDVHEIDVALAGGSMPFDAKFKSHGSSDQEKEEQQPAEDKAVNGGRFFMVHHHFKAGKAAEWWAPIEEMMSDASAWSAMTEKHKELGFWNHTFMPTSRDGPAFCIWEAQPGKTASDFTEFIDGEHGPGMGMMNNNVYEIDVTLTGNSGPYKPMFEQLTEAVEEGKKEGRRVFGSLSNIFGKKKSKSKKNVGNENANAENTENITA